MELNFRTDAPKPWQRWFRFRLRTMLVAIAMISLWLSTTANRANKQRRAVEKIKAAGGVVGYDYEVDGNFNRREDDPSPPGPDWLRNLIGVDYFATVIYVEFNTADDQSLAVVKDLPNLRALELTDDVKLTDAGLECVRDLPQLEALYIDGCEKLTDACLRHLRSLKHLSCLIQLSTGISLEGLQDLQRALPNLRYEM